MTGGEFRHSALALPGAKEIDHFGAPSFRVAGKIFAQLSKDGDRGLVKLPVALQASLVDQRPDCFLVEPQWGRHGWTRVILAPLENDAINDLLAHSWRLIGKK